MVHNHYYSRNLEKLSKQYKVLREFGRGIERETLRVADDGAISQKPHPSALGSALTNRWITTDFAESQLEFVTSVSHDVPTLLAQLTDIHKFAVDNIKDESLWPLSMPCFIEAEDAINLADYGSSNAGKMKHLYRQGLKMRYGSIMQIISGVHFNFSFADSFWEHWFCHYDTQQERADKISDAYLHIIRNFQRYSWMIPYFFGASPVLCASSLQNKKSDLPFTKTASGAMYLPYATALRMSNLGYTSHEQDNIFINPNSLDEYLDSVRNAMKLSSKIFEEKGLFDKKGQRQQLNTNVLQIENELYASIRPKRVADSGQKPSEALSHGIEYIEVRSLDIDPFSAIGISSQQVHFLDQFLVWCLLMPSAPMTTEEMLLCKKNMQSVVLKGRDPKVELTEVLSGKRMLLRDWGSRILDSIRNVGALFDKATATSNYLQNCDRLQHMLDDPEQTRSGQLLKEIKKQEGIKSVAQVLSRQHKQQLLATPYAYYKPSAFISEAHDSLVRRREKEQRDTCDFDTYLDEYFKTDTE